MTLGERIAEGRQAEVYAGEGDETVVKLYRSGFDGYASELAVLARLDGTTVAPRLTGTVRIDGRQGLVLQRLHGPDMLTSLQRQPWHLLVLARALARAALRIHRLQAPADLPDVADVLRGRIRSADLDPRRRDVVLRLLDTLPSGDRLCHGDLHPANAVVTADGVSIIDWPAAARGAPAADVARTLLLLQRADPFPGTPLPLRVLLSLGRAAFANTFARTYRNETPDPLPHLEAWTVVNAAARVAEGVSAERTRLINIIDAAQRGRGALGRGSG